MSEYDFVDATNLGIHSLFWYSLTLHTLYSTTSCKTTAMAKRQISDWWVCF